MDRFGTALDLKTVDVSQRIISGHAAAWALDRVGDVIAPSAFQKTLAEKAPSDVAVFIGHDSSALPVGIPIRIEADAHGLYTETKIFDGPAGDNLLAVAKGLQQHGQTLGLSIGYRVHPGGSESARVDGKMVRRLTSIDLHEYSFAARQTIANPQALMTGVKQLTEEEAKAMPYHIVKDGEQWCVHDSTGKNRGCSDSHDMAIEHMRALYANEKPKTEESMDTENKAVWDTAYVNDLPDSAFMYVESGGQKDDSGKTVPRSLRHFPIKDASGKVDVAHLRNAIARIPQSDAKGLNKDAMQARARRMLDNMSGGGKTLDLDAPEWNEGAVVALSAVEGRLHDLAEALAEEQAAMRRLDQDTKQGRSIRPELRRQISGAMSQLKEVLEWADTVDRGAEEKAVVDRYRRELELLEIA